MFDEPLDAVNAAQWNANTYGTAHAVLSHALGYTVIELDEVTVHEHIVEICHSTTPVCSDDFGIED
tara:strand:- start:3357 stop:3554 length:198 start_codon:yes stop_codon:yes gene_type:complete